MKVFRDQHRVKFFYTLFVMDNKILQNDHIENDYFYDQMLQNTLNSSQNHKGLKPLPFQYHSQQQFLYLL